MFFIHEKEANSILTKSRLKHLVVGPLQLQGTLCRTSSINNTVLQHVLLCGDEILSTNSNSFLFEAEKYTQKVSDYEHLDI